MLRWLLLPLVLFTSQTCLSAQEKSWRAGLAKTIITPSKPMWMSGYASRTKPAEGKINELWAKACLIESPKRQKSLIVTLDLVGIDRQLSQDLRNAISSRVGLKNGQIVLACSHTHSGPVVGNNLRSMYLLDAEQQKRIDEYTRWLVTQVAALAEKANQDLAPASLTWAIGGTDFAVNRRNNKEAEIETIRMKGDLKGPVDHDVPVLAVRSPKGDLRGILFGYACHATVLSGYEWCSDYPGFAADRLETNHPGVIALFWAGCGADQNPLPRRTVVLAKRYGEQLAAAVEATLKKEMMPIKGTNLKITNTELTLSFDMLPTRQQLADDSLSTNRYLAARAKLWLDRMAKGEDLPKTYPYPIHAWKLGEELTWVMLGGEVVVDFSLRLKKEIAPGKTWVMAYANDVMAYIPSLRVLKEGGYEGGGAMVYYGLPAIWSPRVEEEVIGGVKAILPR